MPARNSERYACRRETVGYPDRRKGSPIHGKPRDFDQYASYGRPWKVSPMVGELPHHTLSVRQPATLNNTAAVGKRGTIT